MKWADYNDQYSDIVILGCVLNSIFVAGTFIDWVIVLWVRDYARN